MSNLERKRITILGAGSWGSALACLAKARHDVTLWSRREDFTQSLKQQGANEKYLPGRSLAGVTFTSDLAKACLGADLILFATPTKHLRVLAKQAKALVSTSVVLACVSKGMEEGTFLFVSGIIEEEIPQGKSVVILSGPSHAEEASAGLPTLVVSACPDLAKAKFVQDIFHHDNFRVYTNADRLGVEIGGSVKNIIAIAAGICHELGFGANGISALMTRGMAEIVRLGKKLGGSAETFYGLTGMGDLITTCFSEHSRNRAVGIKLAQGQTLTEIQASMNMVAEGTYAVKGIRAYAKKESLDMPITEAVYRILFEGLEPKKAVQELFSRTAKGE